MRISVVIPAHNEERRIRDVVRLAARYAGEVIVIDDGSTDLTAEVTEAAGAQVIHQSNAGYIAAVKRGFHVSAGDVIVTMDADGEHRAQDIPRLVRPIAEGDADLVLGTRSHVQRPSERFLNWLTNLRVKVRDSGTGFRALRKDLALKLELRARCICGVSVLEPAALGARIDEIPIQLQKARKPRRITWYHFEQFFHVLPWLVHFQGRKHEQVSKRDKVHQHRRNLES